MNTTPATSRFDWHTTAADVIDGIDLTGRRALVTGAASGIGVETARALASAHAEIILAARNLTAADVADDIRASTGNDNVHVAHLDLLDRASIDSLAAATVGEPLHILVNNAGVMDELRNSGRYTYKTIAQGAATSVYVATSPELAGIVGRYFENCRAADPDNPEVAGIDAAGVAAYALDPDDARRLWDLSEQMNS